MTWLALDSEDVADERADESLPKKLKCDERPKPLPDETRRAQLVSLAGGGTPIVGGGGGQLSLGISA